VSVTLTIAKDVTHETDLPRNKRNN